MAQFSPLFCPTIKRLLRSFREQPNTGHLHSAGDTPTGTIIIYPTRCHAPFFACLFDCYVIHVCTSDNSIIVLTKERYKKRNVKLKVFILRADSVLSSVILAKQKNKGLGSSQQAKISAPAAGRKRRFCGSVATLPMLALLWLSRKGREWNGTEAKSTRERLSPEKRKSAARNYLLQDRRDGL